MIGPGRRVRGGVSSVVNTYYELGLDEKVNLAYISTMEDGSKLKKLLVAIMAYLRFCFKLKDYDIVHVHMAAQASFWRKAFFIRKAKKQGKKIIIHQHSGFFIDFFLKETDQKQKQQIKEIFDMAEHVIVLSKEWADFFGEYVCDDKKIITLHNGVVIPESEKTDYSDQNILFLGRLGENKGTYDILKIIPNVLKKVPNAMFYFGGDGDVVKCKAISEKENFAQHVRFLGWMQNTEKEKYLEKCSTYILPSYHEAMPMSVLEAMSYGLATISTNTGGIPQIIENGVDGIRIDAGDRERLEKTLVELLTDESKRKALGCAGRKKIMKCFNVKSNIETLYQLYLDVCNISNSEETRGN